LNDDDFVYYDDDYDDDGDDDLIKELLYATVALMPSEY